MVPTSVIQVKEERPVRQATWTLRRTARIVEVIDKDENVKWRVEVADENRDPFIVQYFGRPDKAENFFERLRDEDSTIEILSDVRF